MRGLMMDSALTVPAILRRAETLFGARDVVSRRADRRLHRSTYAACGARARRLAAALRRLGVAPGDRVATLCWNHAAHLEAYFGIPLAGGVIHTLNLRLPPEDLAYIINHAGDRVLIVDASLLPLFERIKDLVALPHTIVVGEHGSLTPDLLDYDRLLDQADPAPVDLPEPDERDAAAMCYTTGTTGRPKGVLYSHRALVLHSLAIALPDALDLREADTILPVVPMFHANAWGLPYTAALVGAKLVLPGPYLDPPSLVDLFQAERVTIAAGVPTIWMGLLQLLDDRPGAWDLSALRALLVGGSAAPQAMIEAFDRRHGLQIVHAWGMTETTPAGTVSRLAPDQAGEPGEERYRSRARQGRPLPFIEIRARGDDGLVPWDGRTMGELEVRGPWVAGAYFDAPDSSDRFTDDGWFRTGDIVTIDARGSIALTDRAKDLIKSGGEWISSVALENALMGHPDVAEAAVVPTADARWGERPLAVVVVKPGRTVTADALRAFLAPAFPKWWLPEAVEFVSEIPRTSAGKFKKSALRERFGGARPPETRDP
ncbi:MAG TPA: long-chain fatty acid--CoA ligase [Vicinamibacterales bacterium]|nr:long-chain fatty acid--CoA ligase [Vicinamibacterales bacterium]